MNLLVIERIEEKGNVSSDAVEIMHKAKKMFIP